MNTFEFQKMIRESDISSTTKLVLLTLSTYMHPHDCSGCFVHQITLAKACGLGRTSINQHLNLAVKKGLIKRGKNGSKYMVNGVQEMNMGVQEMNMGVQEMNTVPTNPNTNPNTEGERAKKQNRKITKLANLTVTPELVEWGREKTPDVCIADIVESIHAYCQSKNKRYSDYAATVRSWALKDQKEIKQRHAEKQPERRRGRVLGLGKINGMGVGYVTH